MGTGRPERGARCAGHPGAAHTGRARGARGGSGAAGPTRAGRSSGASGRAGTGGIRGSPRRAGAAGPTRSGRSSGAGRRTGGGSRGNTGTRGATRDAGTRWRTGAGEVRGPSRGCWGSWGFGGCWGARRRRNARARPLAASGHRGPGRARGRAHIRRPARGRARPGGARRHVAGGGGRSTLGDLVILGHAVRAGLGLAVVAIRVPRSGILGHAFSAPLRYRQRRETTTTPNAAAYGHSGGPPLGIPTTETAGAVTYRPAAPAIREPSRSNPRPTRVQNPESCAVGNSAYAVPTISGGASASTV